MRSINLKVVMRQHAAAATELAGQRSIEKAEASVLGTVNNRS